MDVVPVQGPLLDRVLDATHALAVDGLDRRGYSRFEAAEMKTAWARRGRQRFALVDGARLLASAAQDDLAGSLDARPVRICGIGSVVSEPVADGSRHAATLIAALVDRAAAGGADVALLFPHPLLAEDAREGFAAIALAEVTLRVTESSRDGAPMTMVRGGEERDLAAIVAMGRVRAGPCRFHLDRDVDFVQYAITRKRLRAGLGPAGARQLHFFIAEEGTTAAAYVVISVEAGRWRLEECGDRDASGARVGALLQALIAREPAERRPKIQGWMPPGFLPQQITITADPATPIRLLARRLDRAAPPLSLSPDEVLYWHDDLF